MPKKLRRVLTEAELIQVKKWASLGATQKMMAALLDMAEISFERMIKKSDALREAIEKGRATSVMNVANVAYQQAITGKNTAMTMFYLKTQGGWREQDRVRVEHTGADGKPLTVEHRHEVFTVEQKDRMAEEHLKKRRGKPGPV